MGCWRFRRGVFLFLAVSGCLTVGASQPGTGTQAGRAAAILVQDSRPRATIVLDSGASQDERDAARELAEHIRLATGARLPVVEGPQTTKPVGTQILVGLGASPALRERLRKLKPDGFVIETAPGRLVLAGRPPDGTSFAVYRFLEKAVGVRWLWPGENGTIIPKTASLAVGAMAVREEPTFLWRALGPGGALWGPADKWTKERELGVSEEHQRAQKLWEKRNRFGGLRARSGHAFGLILPPEKYGPTHPEYFALTGGKREWEDFNGKHRKQPCTTNPDVIRLTVEYCRRYFDEHPDHGIISISPNDGRGFCECEQCRRLDTGAMQQGDGSPDPGSPRESFPIITDRMITFGNQVADQVARTHPGKKVLLLAYSQYNEPPVRVKANPNLLVQYTMRCAGHWNPETEERNFAAVAAWARTAPTLGIYEYIEQVNYAGLPRPIPELIARSVLRLHELGYRYYETQAGDGYAGNGLSYYVLGRTLWDPAADVAAIQRDYIEKGFGAAAPAVTRYFNRLVTRWKEQGRDPRMSVRGMGLTNYRMVAAVYPPQFRDACRRDLRDALAAARGEDRERVLFLERGFRYMDLTALAIEATIPLFELGWKLSPRVVAPAGTDMKQFQTAMAAWERRDQHVESMKNGFEVAYLWIKQNNAQYGFYPLDKMREFAASRRSSLNPPDAGAGVR